MTIKQLASEIAKREGKKSQARIGDIREILGILADIVAEASEGEGCNILNSISYYGYKRKTRKKK